VIVWYNCSIRPNYGAAEAVRKEDGMGLSDYVVNDDHFKAEEDRVTSMCFPCKCCKFAVGEDTAYPCNVCGHNANHGH
jgi:hypothetical protein